MSSANVSRDMEGRQLLIKEIQPFMKNFGLHAIIIDKGFVRRLPNGTDLHTVRAADHTGSISVSIMTGEYFDLIRLGDIFRFKNVNSSIFKSALSVTCNAKSEMVRTGEFLMAFTEKPNHSEFNQELTNAYPPKKPMGEGVVHSSHDSVEHRDRANSKDPRSRVVPAPMNAGSVKTKDPRLHRH